MYEEFYGFKEKPFSMLPDPGFLFLSKKHQAALTLLEYGILNQVGFCVISGEAGAGKTTILRALLERVADNVTVGLITNTHQSFGGLLDWVLSAFDLHQPNLSHVEMHQIFMEYLIKEYADGRTVLLIVDEAQNMKPDALEELRMLSNVNSDKDQLMQVVLAGQPALKETLRKPELMQFAQRIAVDYHLEQLNVVETCGYIQHRLLTAGAMRDIFTPAACERIHCYSGGTPRLINLLCETVLVYGFADQQDMIGVELVDEMVQERMKDSVVPIVNRDAAKNDNKDAALELEKDFPWIKATIAAAEAEKNEALIEKAESVEPAVEVKKESVTSEPAPKKFEKSEVAKAVTSETKNKVKGKAKTSANRGGVEPYKMSVQSDAKKSGENNFPTSAGDEGKRSLLAKYGAIVGGVAVLILIAVFYLGQDSSMSDMIAEEGATGRSGDGSNVTSEQQLKEQRARENVQVKRLKLEAIALKKERDAALAKAKEERRSKQLAAEQAVRATKIAEDKRKAEDKKRLAVAQERERRAKRSEAKAKLAAEKVKLETVKLEEERRLVKARLEKEKRLAEDDQLRRLEREWKEKQRQELETAKALAEQQAIADATAKAELDERSKTSECSGPAARFKAGCR